MSSASDSRARNFLSARLRFTPSVGVQEESLGEAQPVADQLSEFALPPGEPMVGVFEHDDLRIRADLLRERRDVGLVFVAVALNVERRLANALDLAPWRTEDVVVAARIGHVDVRAPSHELPQGRP